MRLAECTRQSKAGGGGNVKNYLREDEMKVRLGDAEVLRERARLSEKR